MEEEKKENQEEQTLEQLSKQVSQIIKKFSEEGITQNDIDTLYKLVDIHKDIANENYWKKKEEFMMYRDYDDYNYGRRGVPGTGRGRYRDGEYGRRGVPGSGRGRYRGDYAIDEMREHYMDYSDANEETMRGNYGAEGEMIKSVEGIMKNIYEIVEELKETNSPDIEQVIKKYARKISEM